MIYITNTNQINYILSSFCGNKGHFKFFHKFFSNLNGISLNRVNLDCRRIFILSNPKKVTH